MLIKKEPRNKERATESDRERECENIHFASFLKLIVNFHIEESLQTNEHLLAPTEITITITTPLYFVCIQFIT